MVLLGEADVEVAPEVDLVVSREGEGLEDVTAPPGEIRTREDNLGVFRGTS